MTGRLVRKATVDLLFEPLVTNANSRGLSAKALESAGLFLPEQE